MRLCHFFVNAFRARSIVVGALAACLAAAPPAGAADEARSLFRAALAQPGTDDDRDPPALQQYLLYPYVQAARLDRRLSSTPGAETDQRIEAFLSAQEDQPVASRLRTRWLLNLAERKAWTSYLRALPTPPEDDLLRCHWLDAQLSLGRQMALERYALNTWLRGRDMPAACNAAFGWLERQGYLTPERYRQRIDAALEAREPAMVRYLARKLPDDIARPLVNAALLQESPTAMLDRLMNTPDAPVDWRWIEQAFDRMARYDSSRGLSRIERLTQTRKPTAQQQAMLWRSLALGLAYDRDPRALAWFARMPAEAHDEASHEWHARTALYAGDWQAVLEVIARMPASLASQARWRYWRARALEQTGDERAKALYAALTEERDPYGFYAAYRIGVVPDLAPQALPHDTAQQQGLQQLPGFQRALELHALDMPDEALAELYASLTDADTQARLQAGLLLHRLGWYPPSIALMAESREWDDLLARFPLPYQDRVEAAAKAVALPSEWIYGIMRAESLYDPRARSGANAYGLLQLLPTTAREVARRHRLPPPSTGTLFEPDTNIALGSHYLAELDERFGGRFVLAIAAYNAGPFRIPDWLPPKEMDADVWIENIPYNETRAYVARVLYNIVIFGWRLNGEPAGIDRLMQPIPAKLG